MQPGDLDWIIRQVTANGGRATLAMLEAALGPAEEGAIAALHARAALAPQLTRLASGELALLRDRIEGAYFRAAPDVYELSRGLLRLEGLELALALACAAPSSGPDLAVAWRAMTDAEHAVHRTRLVRVEEAGGLWALPGLEAWYGAVDFAHGDDVIVHVRDLAGPVLVLDHLPRTDRDEGAIARRNKHVLDAAHAALQDAGATGDWLALERLLRLVVGRFDYRQGLPPDPLPTRLLGLDPRFLLARDGREVRLAHFHADETARRYLGSVGSPEEALGTFLEEYPPGEPGDRDKALATLRTLWRETPRVELGGLTPAQAELRAQKIVPFPRGERDERV